MLVTFAVLLAWTLACWFAQPFFQPFLGLFLFSFDPAAAAAITALWGLLGISLWALRSGRKTLADAISAVRGKPWIWIGLAAIFVLFLVLQLPGLIFYMGVHNSDSAVVGVTSYHIIDGKTRPIYFYGNHYNGSLVAHVTAFFHIVFGRNPFYLQLVDVLFYFGFLVTIFLIAKRFWDGKTALVATLLAAIPPGTVNILIRNTHVAPLVFFGALSLYFTIRIVEDERPRWQFYFWLGVVLGLGMWVQLQAVFYGIAVVATLFFRDKLFFARPRFYLMPAGFLLGAVPVLVDLYYYPGVMLTMFTKQAEGSSDYLARFLSGSSEFLINLPVLLGLKWNARGGLIFAEVVVWAMSIAAISLLVAFVYRSRRTILDAIRMRDVNIGPVIALLFPLVTWFFMSFTARAQPVASFRFFYLHWTSVPLIFASAFYLSSKLRKWVVSACLAAFAVMFAATYPMYSSQLQKRDASMREWFEYCDREHISTYYAGYWRTYLANFCTMERSIGSNIFHWSFEHFEPYYHVVRESDDPPIYLFSPGNNRAKSKLEDELNRCGIGYRKEEVSLGTVITGLSEPARPHQFVRIRREPYGAKLRLASVRGVRSGDEEGTVRVVELEVTNTGKATLPASAMHGWVDLEIRDGGGNVIRRQPLTVDIGAGETVHWRVLIDAGEAGAGPLSARLLVNGLVLNEGKEPLEFDLEPTERPMPGRELDPIRARNEENNRIGDDYLFFSGWGGLTPRNRRLVRESGAAESEVGFFLIRRQPMQLTLVLSPYCDLGFPEQPVGVRIILNDRVLVERAILQTPMRLKIDVPEGYLEEGINRLRLSYDYIEPAYREVDRRVILSVKPHAISLNRISFRRSDSEAEMPVVEYSVPGRDGD